MKMKLSVQMIYRSSIEIDVDQETFDLLEQFNDGSILTPNDTGDAGKAWDWIADHIHESDGHDFEAEIEDIYESQE